METIILAGNYSFVPLISKLLLFEGIFQGSGAYEACIETDSIVETLFARKTAMETKNYKI